MRLREAHLPIEPVVALMSNEHRFAVGASYLLVPLLAGLVGFLVDLAYAPDSQRPDAVAPPGRRATRQGQGEQGVSGQSRGRTRETNRALRAAAVLAAGVALLAVLLRLPAVQVLVQGVALIATVLVAIRFFRRRHLEHGLNEHLFVFLAVLIVSGLTALFVERFRHAEFSSATVVLKDGGGEVKGGYVTSTEQVVVLVTRSGSCGIINAVPRALIETIEVGPATVRPPDCAAKDRARQTL
jgi:hypothetical protein